MNLNPLSLAIYRAGGANFRPSWLFADGAVGGIYNADQYFTQFTTYTSSTNITAPGQAVGFIAGGIPQSDKFLLLDGVSGSYASTPDSAALDITGDIDIRADAVLVDWTPANSDTLAAKWVLTGNQRSYRLFIGSTGFITLITSPDGSAAVNFASTAEVPFTDGSRGKVRATLDVDNGAGNSEAKFYTRTSDSDPWVQLGSTVLGAVTSIFNSTSALDIGSFAAGTSARVTGRIYSAQVYASIDGTDLRADFNPARDYSANRGTTMVSSTTGETYTINGTALVCAEGDLFQKVSAARVTLEQFAVRGLGWQGDGTDDFLNLGISSYGDAVNGWYAAAGNNWSFAFVIQTADAAGSIAAQCGATAGSQMLNAYLSDGVLNTRVRGTNNDSGVTLNDDLPHVGIYCCTNGVLTLSIDGSARTTLTVGAAAAETSMISFLARTPSSPADFLGGIIVPFIIDRALSVAQERQLYQTYAAEYGV